MLWTICQIVLVLALLPLAVEVFLWITIATLMIIVRIVYFLPRIALVVIGLWWIIDSVNHPTSGITIIIGLLGLLMVIVALLWSKIGSNKKCQLLLNEISLSTKQKVNVSKKQAMIVLLPLMLIVGILLLSNIPQAQILAVFLLMPGLPVVVFVSEAYIGYLNRKKAIAIRATAQEGTQC